MRFILLDSLVIANIPRDVEITRMRIPREFEKIMLIAIIIVRVIIVNSA